jgi:hypothetical protein
MGSGIRFLGTYAARLPLAQSAKQSHLILVLNWLVARGFLGMQRLEH